MKILVYCPLNGGNIETSLGAADYSYYFVMQRFLPLLEKFGQVEVLAEPPGDELVARYQQVDEVIYFAFAPPDKVFGPTLCPVVPVFAWEYSTIPYEAFKYPRDNWVEDLRSTGRAITHSNFAVQVVREQLGDDCEIVSIPAPLWDAYAGLREQRRHTPALGFDGLALNCRVIDSHSYAISNTAVRPRTGVEIEQGSSDIWDGEALTFSFARGESGPTLVGFNDPESWGVWSRSGHPWLLLDEAIEGEVELEISVMGYAHNVGEPLGVELGNSVAYLHLSENLQTHIVRMTVHSPTNFLLFSGVEKRAVNMDDPRDISFGLARLNLRRIESRSETATSVVVDFTTDEMALQGFHGRESQGCWTGARHCSLQLPKTLAGDLDITIECFRLLHNHRRTIDLQLGMTRKQLTLNKRRRTYSVSMAGVAPTDYLRLDNLGIGQSGNEDDPRELGLGLSRITITARPGLKDQHIDGQPAVASTDNRLESPPANVLYTAILNPNDGRKNWEDIITAFVYALRDKPGATLLVKITNQELRMFLEDIFTFLTRLHPFKCRIVFIHGYLSDTEYQQLILHSHYVVNASRGEGQCLPLMEFMSSGVPAIAPCNTAMRDYIDDTNAFIVESSPELTYWPHDPRQVYRTYWHRINWQTLYEAYVQSEALFSKSPEAYRNMCDSAAASLEKFCSMRVASERFRHFIESIMDQGKR